DLRFLEIGIDPDVAQRAYRHEALANLHMVARIYIAPGDHPVDLRHNGAVAQIEIRLIEIAPGFQQRSLGFLQRWGFLDDPSINFVNVAAWIALVKLLEDLLRSEVVGRLLNAKKRR